MSPGPDVFTKFVTECLQVDSLCVCICLFLKWWKFLKVGIRLYSFWIFLILHCICINKLTRMTFGLSTYKNIAVLVRKSE